MAIGQNCYAARSSTFNPQELAILRIRIWRHPPDYLRPEIFFKGKPQWTPMDTNIKQMAKQNDFAYCVQLAMTDTEKNVLASLVELDNTVKAMSTAIPKPNLQPLFSRLDQLTRQLPPTTDPNLLHYLHKKSYQKARLFLEGRDEDNAQGNCRHV